MGLPVLPSIIVEAALVANNPVADTNALILDSGTQGLLGTDFLGGFDTWTDISPWLRGFTITRPSTRLQGPLLQFQAGTASITLNNADGRFDPDNLDGPYVIDGVTQVHAMVPIRIRAVFNNVTYYLFKGFADSWQEPQITWADTPADWTLSATDGFKMLDGITLATLGSPVGANEDTGARVNRLLNAANWYTGQGGGARFVDTGDSHVQATSYGDTVLNLLQAAVDSEIGQLYIDGSGAVVFRHRKALLIDDRSATSQVTFSDDPSGDELPCAQINRADDDTTIANDIQAQIDGSSNLQEVKDAASIAKYLFPRTYNREDLILTSDSDALNWANWVLYISKNSENRFESVVVDPQYQPNDLWPQVLGREIGDRITCKRTPLNVNTVTREGFIASVTHTYDVASSAWSTSWTLQDASKYGSFMTLDNPVTGQLDNNALVY